MYYREAEVALLVFDVTSRVCDMTTPGLQAFKTFLVGPVVAEIIRGGVLLDHPAPRARFTRY
jgi:hypothetical protein